MQNFNGSSFISFASKHLEILAVSFFILTVHGSAKAADLSNFVAGKYELQEGEEKWCGDGDFYITQDGKVLMLAGGKYSFTTTPHTSSYKSGKPEETGCLEQAATTIESKNSETKLTWKMTLHCAQMDRQIDTNQATLTKKRITLDQSQWVNPEYHQTVPGNPHRCVWQKKRTG